MKGTTGQSSEAAATELSRKRSSMKRRDFLKVSAAAGGGLLVAVSFPWGCTPRADAEVDAETVDVNAWLRVGLDGRAHVVVDRSEMGQGVLTAVAMLLAEELDVPFEDVRVDPAPSDPSGWVRSMGTGGSWSIRSSWEPLRVAGAAAREMMVAAAAARWEVDASDCATEAGHVVHAGSNRRLGYGELVEAASQLPAPEEPRLKDPADFRLIGTTPPRIDTPLKVDGTAEFGMDVKVPGMLVAAIERCPVNEGTPVRVDDAAARALPGVRDVLVMEHGVAVLGDGYWPVMEGRKALEIEWDHGRGAGVGSADLRAELARLASRPGAVAADVGNAAGALRGGARRIQADFTLPYLSHSPMEPMNCTADVREDRCEIWVPTQVQSSAQRAAAAVAGLPVEAVTLHTTFLGGGFGRRLEVDYVEEAVELSQRAGAPVKVVWSREDDTRHGFYRPCGHHRMEAALDGEGRLVAWTHRVAAPSIARFRNPEAASNGIDGDTVAGAAVPHYSIPNLRVECALADFHVPVGYWRGVGHTQTGFVVETFLDEVAEAAGRDPADFRLELLRDSPRDRAVVQLAVDRSEWGAPLPEGRGRGIAYYDSFGSKMAQVVELSVESGRVRVHRIVNAIDCGIAVHPDQIRAQMESAAVFGLTAALRAAITVEDGRVSQGNFNDHELLRIDEMPRVDVHIIPSAEPPGGIGEPGIPPLAAAVANALHAVTGRRHRSIPLEAGVTA